MLPRHEVINIGKKVAAILIFFSQISQFLSNYEIGERTTMSKNEQGDVADQHLA